MARPYEALWLLLEKCRPSSTAFKKHLSTLTAEELVARYADTVDATGEVRGREEGVFVPELDGYLSEDDMEDFTDWIVAQGYEVWMGARGADDEVLAALFQTMAAEREGAKGRWKGQAPAIGPAMFVAFGQRFEGKTFLDRVDTELERRT